eukprot:1853511-Prymnesium_polylepis.1
MYCVTLVGHGGRSSQFVCVRPSSEEPLRAHSCTGSAYFLTDRRPCMGYARDYGGLVRAD